jgi:hypothetical protein
LTEKFIDINRYIPKGQDWADGSGQELIYGARDSCQGEYSKSFPLSFLLTVLKSEWIWGDPAQR